MTSLPSDRPVSALRARMIEDMNVRGFSEKTRNDYIRSVRAFAAFVGRSPDTATAEDLRRFQHHQAQTGVRPPSINSAVAALRFFFTVTLDRPDLSRRLTVVREPRRLPAELVPLARFLLQYGVAPRLEGLEPLIECSGNAVIEPNGGARDPFEQPTVVADQHNAGAQPRQLALQPLDTEKIKVIGRFVEQQDIGQGGQRARQGGAARLTAGQGGGVFFAREAEFFKQI
jgi:hypothetical protein